MEALLRFKKGDFPFEFYIITFFNSDSFLTLQPIVDGHNIMTTETNFILFNKSIYNNFEKTSPREIEIK